MRRSSALCILLWNLWCTFLSIFIFVPPCYSLNIEHAWNKSADRIYAFIPLELFCGLFFFLDLSNSCFPSILNVCLSVVPYAVLWSVLTNSLHSAHYLRTSPTRNVRLPRFECVWGGFCASALILYVCLHGWTMYVGDFWPLSLTHTVLLIHVQLFESFPKLLPVCCAFSPVAKFSCV